MINRPLIVVVMFRCVYSSMIPVEYDTLLILLNCVKIE